MRKPFKTVCEFKTADDRFGAVDLSADAYIDDIRLPSTSFLGVINDYLGIPTTSGRRYEDIKDYTKMANVALTIKTRAHFSDKTVENIKDFNKAEKEAIAQAVEDEINKQANKTFAPYRLDNITISSARFGVAP